MGEDFNCFYLWGRENLVDPGNDLVKGEG